MFISTFKVTNYRSIVSETFDFDLLGVLIGKNNAGKTNVLAAIALMLEGTAKSLTSSDYNDVTQEIEVEAEIRNVRAYLPLSEERHRPRFEACILDGDFIRVRRRATPADGLGKLEIWQPSEEEFGTPTGIDAAFKQLLPEVILIEAFVDPASEAEGKDSAALGKILKVILEGIRADTDEAVTESLKRVNALLNVVVDEAGAESDDRASGLRETEGDLSRFLREGFDGAAARIRIDMPELPHFLGRARVDLHDGGEWTEARLKGQGQQRVLYVALLRTLALQKRRGLGTTRPFLLLVEEPEAFLHPSAHIVLRSALETIAKENQVLFTTHSPSMVAPAQARETILVRKQAMGGGRVGTMRLRPLRLQLEGKDRRVKHLFEYPRSSKFLFADKVFIVEGSSDTELLEAMVVQLGQQSFEDCGLACVDAGNKTLVKECMDVLGAQGLLAYGVVDCDFLWRGCGSLLSGDPAYGRFRGAFWADCQGRGWVDDSGDTIRKANKAAAFALLSEPQYKAQCDAIRLALRENHRVWVLEHGEIEGYVGMTSSSKGDYTEVASLIRAGERQIQHSDEVRALFEWTGIVLPTGIPV